MWSLYGLQKCLLLVTPFTATAVMLVQGEGISGHTAAPAAHRSILPGAGSGMPPSLLWAAPLRLLLLLALLPAKWTPDSPPECAPEDNDRLSLAPVPARLCPAPLPSRVFGKAGRVESLLPPLLQCHASPIPISLHYHAACFEKHCLHVPPHWSPIIFKEKLPLINHYHSKDPLREVGLNFLYH